MDSLPLTLFDYAVLAVLAVSILLSMMRGVVRELLSLAGWVIAFMVANAFAAGLAPLLPAAVTGESVRLMLAFAALFLSVLLATGLAAMLVSALVKTAGLGFADRFFGFLFGALRGFLLVLLLVLAAGLTALPQEPFWQKALLSKPLEAAALMAMPWLPQDLSRRISYVRLDQAGYGQHTVSVQV
ncbi:CvpA family protein [Nitrosovibrio sp. Nv17]|jgi:membrane protein required for colicin V production|uniref:CvpA family protein n=1 Tax=Nitrosovibrio sp. Nv17 TaxID=1855339 RepID=UPI000908AD58|nr:CvpA family protein [Nitrosovibrio sp. Nv17]SFW21972.1 membrane protein required for colicin V production [Nitrosovibrio sp. Nv17]